MFLFNQPEPVVPTFSSGNRFFNIGAISCEVFATEEVVEFDFVWRIGISDDFIKPNKFSAMLVAGLDATHSSNDIISGLAFDEIHFSAIVDTPIF